MESGDKGLAIFLVAVFVGVCGSFFTPWAIPSAAVAIAAIAFAPTPKDAP